MSDNADVQYIVSALEKIVDALTAENPDSKKSHRRFVREMNLANATRLTSILEDIDPYSRARQLRELVAWFLEMAEAYKD